MTSSHRTGDRIVAIGKEMAPHDCYDTGVFAVGAGFFAALGKSALPVDHRSGPALAASGQAGVVDCSDLDWLDVDDAKALAWAEAWLAGASAP